MARVRGLLDRHLFRIRPTEPLPAVLGHRRIFVLPTGFGMAFFVTLLTMLVASMNYALSLGYALTFTLAGVGIVSLHQTFRNLVHLELRSASLQPVFCGEQALLSVVFENPSTRPRTALEIFEGRSARVRFSVGGRESQAVGIAIPAARRGWLVSDRLTLETRYPMGLIRGWSYLTPAARCLVYPRPESPAVGLPDAAARQQGGTLGEFGEDDFAGLREYRAGDSPKQIAWKLAARNEDQLHTKQFQGGRQVRLELDWASLPQELDVEQRLSRLTRWVCDATQRDLPFSMRIPGFEADFARGRDHMERCLKALALYGADDGRS